MDPDSQSNDKELPPDPALARGDLRQVRTFESDAAEAVQEGQMTASELVLAEQKKNAESDGQETVVPQNPKPNAAKRNLFVLSSSILFGAGLIIVAVYFLFFQPEPPILGPAFSGKPILSINSEIIIDVTGKKQSAIVSLVAEAFKKNIGVGNIVNLKLAHMQEAEDGSTYPAPLATDSALRIIAPSVPSTLTRVLDGNYALAVMGYDGNHPLLILKTKEFDNAYAGMLSWEKTLHQDLGELFIEADISTLVGTTPITEQDTYFGTDPRSHLFTDAVIKNLNVRVIRDQKGAVAFIYAFADKETIVMTDSEKAFSEIVDRLRRSRLILQ